MNELLRYEQEVTDLLPMLPLPDENAAWLDMKHRLDKDDDDGIIIPFRKGCGLTAFALIVLTGIGWWLLKPQKWFTPKNKISSADTISSRDQNDSLKDRKKYTYINDTSNKSMHASSGKTQVSVDTAIVKQEKRKIDSGKINPGTSEKTNFDLSRPKTRSSLARINPGKEPHSKISTSKKINYTNSQNTNSTHEINDQYNLTTSTTLNTEETPGNHITPSKSVLPLNDSSIQKKNQDTVSIKKDSTQAKKQNKKIPEKKSFSFAAGIALQQQIPFNGQSAVPYNYYGRKGSLSDYIPSIYLRMYRDKKWFLQSEFRYGAPQYLKEYQYSAVTVSDSNSQSTITRSLRVKKTYYHQVPISFNYFLLPNWSIGTGIMWSKFYGAVIQEELTDHNNISQTDSVISNKIVQVKGNTDSFFTKSQISWLIEGQYKWKQFSFGLRYIQGLQPYIKYSDAAGIPRQEKNVSLQFFIRYELWKSKSGKK